MNQKNALSILGICVLLAACGTGETISFKGVPLDQPGVKDALKIICKENKSNDDESCSFKYLYRSIWISYGVLTDNLAFLKFAPNGSLIEIEVLGSKGEMLAQVETLNAKYGKPAKTTEQVTNGFGTKFDKDIFS